MADGFAQTQILGNIGGEPELKRTQGGQPYLQFSVAVGKSWKKDGEKKESTQWYRCKVWGDRAEGLAKYLHKGDRIHAVGEMQSSKYQKDGKDLEFWELRVERVTFCGSPKRDGGGTSGANDGGGYDPDLPPDNGEPLPF